MHIRQCCHRCGFQFRVEAKFVGQRVACPNPECRAEIELSYATDPPESAVPPDDDTPDPSELAPSKGNDAVQTIRAGSTVGTPSRHAVRYGLLALGVMLLVVSYWLGRLGSASKVHSDSNNVPSGVSPNAESAPHLLDLKVGQQTSGSLIADSDESIDKNAAGKTNADVTNTEGPSPENLDEKIAGGAAPKKELPLADLIREVERSVVEVHVEQGDGAEVLGSGFFAFDGRTVVTNYHVVENARQATVALSNKMEIPVLGFVAVAPEFDIVILRLELSENSPKPLELSSGQIEKGTEVLAFGSPKGLSGTVSTGIVSAVRNAKAVRDALRDEAGSDIYANEMHLSPDAVWIQTSTPISHGNSGGPLVTRFGQVVGVNTMMLIDAQNMNFAISVEHVRKLAEANPKADAGKQVRGADAPVQLDSKDNNVPPIAGKGKSNLLALEAVRPLGELPKRKRAERPKEKEVGVASVENLKEWNRALFQVYVERLRLHEQKASLDRRILEAQKNILAAQTQLEATQATATNIQQVLQAAEFRAEECLRLLNTVDDSRQRPLLKSDYAAYVQTAENAAIALRPVLADADVQNRNVQRLIQIHKPLLAEQTEWYRRQSQLRLEWLNLVDPLGKFVKGDTQRAILIMSEWIILDAEYPLAYVCRGLAYTFTEKYDQAFADMSKAVALEPRLAFAVAGRAFVYHRLGQRAKARSGFAQAVSFEKNDDNVLTLQGLFHQEIGDYSRAIANYRKASVNNPRNIGAQLRLAALLATCPDDQFRNAKEAITIAKGTVELTKNEMWQASEILASAYAENDDFDSAIALQKDVLNMAVPENLRPERVERLKSYQRRQPWRLQPPLVVK